MKEPKNRERAEDLDRLNASAIGDALEENQRGRLSDDGLDQLIAIAQLRTLNEIARSLGSIADSLQWMRDNGIAARTYPQ